eukprot:2584811-Rhodomonas_salina.1
MLMPPATTGMLAVSVVLTWKGLPPSLGAFSKPVPILASGLTMALTTMSTKMLAERSGVASGK